MASIEDFLELAWVRPEQQTMPHEEPAPPDGDRDQRRWLLFAPAEIRVDAVGAHERRWPGAAALAQLWGEVDEDGDEPVHVKFSDSEMRQYSIETVLEALDDVEELDNESGDLSEAEEMNE